MLGYLVNTDNVTFYLYSIVIKIPLNAIQSEDKHIAYILIANFWLPLLMFYQESKISLGKENHWYPYYLTVEISTDIQCGLKYCPYH